MMVIKNTFWVFFADFWPALNVHHSILFYLNDQFVIPRSSRRVIITTNDNGLDLNFSFFAPCVTWFSTNLHKSFSYMWTYTCIYVCLFFKSLSVEQAEAAAAAGKRDKLINKKPIKISRIVKVLRRLLTRRAGKLVCKGAKEWERKAEKDKKQSQKAPKYFFFCSHKFKRARHFRA